MVWWKKLPLRRLARAPRALHLFPDSNSWTEQVMCWVGPPSAMVCLDLATDCLVNNYLLQERQLAPDDSPSMFLMTRFRSLFWSWVVLPCQTGSVKHVQHIFYGGCVELYHSHAVGQTSSAAGESTFSAHFPP